MNGFVLCVLLLVVSGCSQDLSLDKTGTSGVRFGSVGSKTLEKQEPAEAGSFLAERAGFEPAVEFYFYAALAKRWRNPPSPIIPSTFASSGESGVPVGVPVHPTPISPALLRRGQNCPNTSVSRCSL